MTAHTFAQPVHRKQPAPVGKPLALAVALALAAPHAVFGAPLPAGEHNMTGIASITRTGGTAMVVNQSAASAIINWGEFNIAAGSSVRFNQPTSGVVLNRVDAGGGASLIEGSMSGNGRVFLVNQSGIFFGAGATVSVGGLVASTLDIADNDFLTGRYLFSNNAGRGIVSNEGSLTAVGTSDGAGTLVPGTVALLGTTVTNTGTMTARLGTVAMASGGTVTLDFNGDGLTQVAVSAATLQAMVENGGAIIADGGTVVMSAALATSTAAALVRQTGAGTIRAQSLVERNGKLVLDAGAGGTVDVAGTLDASNAVATQGAGDVLLNGKTIQLGDGALVDVRSSAGNGGLVQVLATDSITQISTGAIKADALATGNGGNINLLSDNALALHGSATATTGDRSGNGGTVRTVSPVLDASGFRVDASLPAGVVRSPGTWSVDAANVDIAGTLAASVQAALQTDTSVSVSNSLYGGNNGIEIGQSLQKFGSGRAGLTVASNGNITVGDDVLLRGQNGILDVTLISGLSGAGGIVMNPGSAILTWGGDIVLSGNNSGTSRTADDSFPASGVLLNNAVLDSRVDLNPSGAGGNITMTGIGSTTVTSEGNAAAGIRMVDASIRSGTGAIALTGTGGLNTNLRTGTGTGGDGIDLVLTNAGSGFLSTTGDITLVGHEGQSWLGTAAPSIPVTRGSGMNIVIDQGSIVASSAAISILGDAAGPLPGPSSGGSGGYGTVLTSSLGIGGGTVGPVPIKAGGALTITGLANGTGSTGLRASVAQLATTAGGTLSLLGRSDSAHGVELYDMALTTKPGASGQGNIVIAGESAAAATGVQLGSVRIGGAGMGGAVSISALNQPAGAVDASPMLTVAAGQPDIPDTLTSITTSNVINFRPGGVSTSGAATESFLTPITVGANGDPFRVALPDFHIASGGASPARVVIGSSEQVGGIIYANNNVFNGNLTLQNDGAGSVGIALTAPLNVTGAVTLSSGGTVASNQAITAASLLLHGSRPETNFQLTSTGNAVGTLAAVYDAPPGGGNTTFGNVNFVNNGALTLGGLFGDGYSTATHGATQLGAQDSAVTGNFLVRTTGALTLQQNVATTRGAITLATGTVLNNSAARTLTPGVGSAWQVYAATWTGEARGGLAGSAPRPNLYNCAYGASCAANLPGNGFIYAAQPTVTLTGDTQSRIYGDANPALTYSVTGLINGDTVATALAGGYGTAATISSNVGTYATTGTFTSPEGYLVQSRPGALTIDRAALLITATNASKVYGGADPEVTYLPAGLKAGDGPGVVTGVQLARVTGAAATAGTHAITASGGTAQNYTITYQPGTLTVVKALLTVGADNQTKVYGAADPLLTATYDGFQYADTRDVVTGLQLGTVTGAAATAGTHAINASGAFAQNYSVAYQPGTLTVDKALLTVSANNQSKVYGAADPALSATYAGLQYADTSAVVSGLQLNTVTGAAATAGTHAIIGSGATAQNYSVAYQPGTLTVDKALLTVSANNQSKVYGAADPALSASYAGLQYADTRDVVTGLQLGTVTGAAATAGTHAIDASGATAQNYTISYQPGMLTVARALLTIIADNKAKVYGDADPALTATVTGLQYADTRDVVQGLALTAPQGAAATAGVHAITPAGASAANYAMQYAPGQLTVTPAVLSYTAAPTTQFAGAPAVAPSGTVTGFVYGDAPGTATSGTLAFSTTATLASGAGTYPVQGSGLSAANYTFVQAPVNASALVVLANPVVDLPTVVKDVTFESSNVYTKNVGTPRVCVATGSFAGSGNGDNDDPLAMEWSRVKVSPNLSNCLSMGQRNSCSDF